MMGTIEVDLGAIRRNAARLRALVAPTRLMAILKSNAYGHGAVRIARVVAPQVDALGVYRVQEAIELRSAGVSIPISVLGPVSPDELSEALANHVTIPIWTTGSYLRDVERTARSASSPFLVQAKIETGLSRLGFSAAGAGTGIAELRDKSELRFQGVYTHLASAEDPESPYTKQQLARFRSALAPLDERKMLTGVIRHAAASAAAILLAESRLDMVRCGIALYGLWPSPATQKAARGAIELEPALRYRTQLISVREVPANQAVGYGCTFVTKRPSRIGILPLGYAEGVPRALSNRGSTLVAGHTAPIVGRICMNMSFIDVTGIVEARPGTPVTLIGRDGAARVSADDWANWTGSINYEIIARLPRELPRSYVDSSRARVEST